MRSRGGACRVFGVLACLGSTSGVAWSSFEAVEIVLRSQLPPEVPSVLEVLTPKYSGGLVPRGRATFLGLVTAAAEKHNFGFLTSSDGTAD